MRCELTRRPPSLPWAAVLAAAAAVPRAGPALAGLLREAALPACVFKGLTGLPCAACGTTRAAAALLEGSVGKAVALQPLGTALMAAFAAGAVLVAAAGTAGVAVRVALSDGEKMVLRLAAAHLFLVHWLYLIDAGV